MSVNIPALSLRAPAKINLTLEVIGRRDDGYHEIVSVMQAIDLCDELEIAPARVLSFTCDDPSLSGEDNLVVRAARMLQDETSYRGAAAIRLRKKIPQAAGLGGGSADAARTLRALNQVWELGLNRTRLLALAAQLGSDVPFFLFGGTCLAEGRGERLTPMPDLPRRPVVLLKPALAVPTAKIYAATTAADYSDGRRSRALAAAIEGGQPWDPALLCNTLEPVATRLHPQIGEAVARFRAAGAGWVRLSGSGPTLFTVPESDAAAERVFDSLRRDAAEVYFCHTQAREPDP
jgi:4-diphosphocytidyl-2-C-methyl-D-erythritol kinase